MVEKILRNMNELHILSGGAPECGTVSPELSGPRYVDVKTAAEKTGFTEQYLRDLYLYPGQRFAVKKDPRKKRSHIMYDLREFYEWLKKSNKAMAPGRRRV